jgi:hypothetical protein
VVADCGMRFFIGTYRRFGGTYRLHIHGRENLKYHILVSFEVKKWNDVERLIASMMEAANTSETSANFY